MALRSGKAIHFYEKNVRSVGRISLGVKGVTLSKDDKVVSMVITNKVSNDLLVVSENGFGKRSNINDYRITKRGCKGIKTMQVTNKTGLLVSAKCVSESDEIMIINKSGIIIRISVSDIRIIGRDTQGVRLIRLQKDDKISFVEKIENIYK
ncbi:MAG: DNA gyrase C-terminal beta-propeller domain-containing protein [Cytophagales bacterium]